MADQDMRARVHTHTHTHTRTRSLVGGRVLVCIFLFSEEAPKEPAPAFRAERRQRHGKSDSRSSRKRRECPRTGEIVGGCE